MFIPSNCVARFEFDWAKQDSTSMLNLLKGVAHPGSPAGAACACGVGDAHTLGDHLRNDRNLWGHQKPISAAALHKAVGHAEALLVALKVPSYEWRGLMDACGDPSTFLTKKLLDL